MERWRLIYEETAGDVDEERLNLGISTVKLQAGRADMHADRGGGGHERDGAEVTLAAEALALEATGDRTPLAGDDCATIGGGHD